MQKPLCFTVMWFDKQMDDVYDAVSAVAQELGYECGRADSIAFTGEINPKVRDLIREAAVIVADLTGARPNVYYEVGYAHALGKAVLLTVREEDVPRIGFDLAGFRHVKYSTHRELRTQLRSLMADAVGPAKAAPSLQIRPAEGEATDELEASLHVLNERVESNAQDTSAYVSRAAILRALGRADEAYRDLVVAIDSNPREIHAYLDLAHMLNGLRRFEESLEITDRALKIDNANTKAWCLRGYALNGMRRYEEGAEAAKRALALEPGNGTAERLLAVAQSFLRESQAGSLTGEQVLSPRDEMLALGYSLNNSGQYEEALEAYEKAVRIDPLSVAAHMGHGYTLNRLKRHEEALTSYNHAIELDPSNAGAYIQRGFTLNALRRFEEAAASVRQGLVLEPGSRAGLSVLSTALRHTRA
jgi:tetratricopeptide (TPR) repeat protein